MKTLSLDIETFSDVNLNKTGVYAYACSPNFEILLLSYSVDGGKVEVVDLARGEKLPEEIADAIKSRDVIKWAFNAQFERVCLSKYFMENIKVMSSSEHSKLHAAQKKRNIYGQFIATKQSS